MVPEKNGIRDRPCGIRASSYPPFTSKSFPADPYLISLDPLKSAQFWNSSLKSPFLTPRYS